MVGVGNGSEASVIGTHTTLEARDGSTSWGRRRRPTIALVAAVALACAVVAGLVAYAVTPRPVAKGPVNGVLSASGTASSGPGAGLPVIGRGKPAPGFSLPRLGGGGPVTLSAYRGRPVVLNFFASWCPDCRAELQAFAAVSDASAGKVAFVGIDTNDSNPANAMSLLRAAGDRYAVGVDPNASVANGKYLVEALPSTVFISASGHIVGQVFGPQTTASLSSWIRLLESPASSGARSAP